MNIIEASIFGCIFLAPTWALAGSKGTELPPGGVLLGANEDYIEPVNHRIQLRMQTDCNLVVYSGNKIVWATGTDGKGRNCAAIMQYDGNLVVYRNHSQQSQGETVWATNTDGRSGGHLRAQGDGNVVIYVGPEAIWETGKRVVVSGSYYNSCHDIKEANGILYATCDTGLRKRFEKPSLNIGKTFLPNYNNCRGDIANFFGTLVCAHPAPNGSYKETCHASYLDDNGRLHAMCRPDGSGSA